MHWIADLVEGREDQAQEALVQHLVGSLCLDVYMRGQHSDVWVGVVPANHAGLHPPLAGELLCCCRTSGELLRAGLHPVLKYTC